MASITASPAASAVDEDEIPERRMAMSYDEYIAWCESAEGNRGEWVDGEAIVFMTTSDRHARIVDFLIAILGNYLNRRRVGQLRSQEFELRTREGAAFEPDIFVFLNEHVDRLEALRFRGAADVVVEVISPDSVTRDRIDKRDEYAVTGVPEYWLIDPRDGRESAQILMLDPTGRHAPVMPDPDGRLYSRILPGVWFDPAWLAYGDELPDLIDLSLAMVAAAEGWTATSPDPSA